jgi:hypothetical protein
VYRKADGGDEVCDICFSMQYRLTLLVRSNHPVKPAGKIVSEMMTDLSGLESKLTAEAERIAREGSPEAPPRIEVKASMEKTEAFPDGGTLVILGLGIIASGALKKIGERLAEVAMDYLRDHYRNAMIEMKEYDEQPKAGPPPE